MRGNWSKIWLIFIFTLNVGRSEDKNPDQGLSVTDLILKYGYPLEVHTVVTEDKYVLKMHRIPRGKNCEGENCGKRAVLLMHGLLCSSVDWVNTGPTNGLAYVLADAGYDVWLGNARGNTHSRKHMYMNPDKVSDFWEFSWHEIGYYDLPAKIDFILKETGHEKIFYIGHSQGTTSFFVMASERPEYNDKITMMTALAPIAFMSNMDNPIVKILSYYHSIYETSAALMGINEFLPNHEFLVAAGQLFCQEKSYYVEMCSNSLFLIAGWNSHQLNRSVLPVILSNTPAGASTRQFLHYAQEIKSGRFCRYDFGPVKNHQLYGSIYPPDYNLENIKVPVALFYSENDALAGLADVENLGNKLPNVVTYYNVPLKEFNHIDYMWAIDVVELVYKPIIKLMGKFT